MRRAEKRTAWTPMFEAGTPKGAGLVAPVVSTPAVGPGSSAPAWSRRAAGWTTGPPGNRSAGRCGRPRREAERQPLPWARWSRRPPRSGPPSCLPYDGAAAPGNSPDRSGWSRPVRCPAPTCDDIWDRSAASASRFSVEVPGHGAGSGSFRRRGARPAPRRRARRGAFDAFRLMDNPGLFALGACLADTSKPTTVLNIREDWNRVKNQLPDPRSRD